MKEYDFVVIGSGIAGLSFALKAAKHGSVAVITKRKGSDTNTAWAQGGIACVTSDEDSFELHVRDTLEAGAGLCDENVVRTIVTEAPARIQDLVELSVQFDEREISGHREFDLGREGGHSKRRVLHVQDVTGKEIENALLRELERQSHVDLLENHIAVDLITAAKIGYAAEDRCLGIYILDENSGEVETIRSDRIVLATGGCGKVYLYTTNPDIATGDGVAMAWRAGVEIANMEFIQFHPTCLFHSAARSFLISEAVRGEGGILRNSRGEEFMSSYHAGGSLAPRDVVARAIDAEIKRSGAQCVYLDITHRPAEFVRERPIGASKKITLPEWVAGDVQNVDELVVIYHNWDEIRRLMWDYVSIVRTDKRLQRAASRLRNLQREIHDFYWNFKISVDLLELRNLATVAALIVDSGLLRKESRGLHYTLDYPGTDNARFRHDTLLVRA